MNFFQRFRKSYDRFMQGRYGTDLLNRHLVLLWLVLAIVNLFARSLVLYCVELILCLVVFYRMLSRNIVRRRKESAAYYRLQQRFFGALRHLFVRIRDRKVARFFKCPHCGASIRMPRKVGRFRIRCQKCGGTFEKEFKK